VKFQSSVWAASLGLALSASLLAGHTGPAAASDSGASFSDAAGNSVTLRDTTVLLDPSSQALLVSANSDRLVFTDARFPQARELAPGSVVIIPAADPVMIYIDNVRRSGQRLIVTGRPATIEEAYSDLRVKKTLRFTDEPTISSQFTTVRSKIVPTPRVRSAWTYSFWGAGVKTEEDAAEGSLSVSGSFSIEPEVSVDIDLGASRYEFSVVANPSVTVDLEASASFSVEAPLRLAEIDFQRKVFFIGPVPVELHPKLGLDVTVEATGSAGIKARVIDYAQEIRLGVGYQDGAFRNTSEPVDPLAGFRRPSLVGSASAEGSITLSAELFINLYEVAGPTVALELAGALHVEPLESRWAWVEVDVNILLGGRVSLLGQEDGPGFSFDLAPDLGPWVVWEATRRDPSTFKGVVGFSKPITGLELRGMQCLSVDTAGVSPESISWRLPEAAIAAGLRLATSEQGGAQATEITGTQACVFSGSQEVRTYLEVRVSPSSKPTLHSVVVSGEIVNPPLRPTGISTVAEYEGALVSWTAKKDPSYWTVTATTKDRKVPVLRRSVTRTTGGTARELRIQGLEPRVNYTVTVTGTNDAGAGSEGTAAVRPLGRIQLVGSSAPVGAWADIPVSTLGPKPTGGLMLLASGRSALAIVPASKVSRGATGETLAKLRLRDGSVEWFAKDSAGRPIDVWRGSDLGLYFADRTFIANPSGTTIIAFRCETKDIDGSCRGAFYRFDSRTSKATELSKPLQDALFSLWGRGTASMGDWAISANGRLLAMTAPQQKVQVWDLTNGRVSESQWTPQTCGENRCASAVLSVAIAANKHVVVAVENATSTGSTPSTCMNRADLWLWDRATGTRKILSPSQPRWETDRGRSSCRGSSRFILPVGASAAPVVVFYQGDYTDNSTATWHLNIETGKAWSPSTFPIQRCGCLGGSGPLEVSKVPRKPGVSSDGQVLGIAVSMPAEDGMLADIFIGAQVCHIRAKACTVAFGNTTQPEPHFNSLFFGGAQLSASGRELIYLGYNRRVPSLVESVYVFEHLIWWRQALDPSLD
jgi:hypothetical protein